MNRWEQITQMKLFYHSRILLVVFNREFFAVGQILFALYVSITN
ncbi:hypothetical protein [Acetivibrio ethanolgignens]|nr:hypothetical protein [Acetivibrio ethanolgignens]